MPALARGLFCLRKRLGLDCKALLLVPRHRRPLGSTPPTGTAPLRQHPARRAARWRRPRGCGWDPLGAAGGGAGPAAAGAVAALAAGASAGAVLHGAAWILGRAPGAGRRHPAGHAAGVLVHIILGFVGFLLLAL